MDRFLKKQILEDLNEKMVLLAGPRQVGKTTLARSLQPHFDYLNWDIDSDRTRILSKEFKKSSLWIFDEIHKFKNWRNYLKGIYDQLGKTQKILVTGSAKLDVLRKGGDSLQGRYHFLRLFPMTFKELKMQTSNDCLELFKLNGFPEPFFKGSKAGCDRWSRSYREKIIRNEVATTEQIIDLGTMEIMYQRLPELASGILSVNSLSEDLQISHKTVSKWIAALERLYAVFRISPFGPPKVKAVKKEQKIYFFDWNAVVDEGARFENFVAVHLLKWVAYEQDTKGRNLDLRFYKDKYSREVDFIIIENNQPILMIEVKLSDSEVSKGLISMKKRYPKVRALQLHLKGKKEYVNADGIEVNSVASFLDELV